MTSLFFSPNRLLTLHFFLLVVGWLLNGIGIGFAFMITLLGIPKIVIRRSQNRLLDKLVIGKMIPL
jgi:hypothetical protein